MSGIAVSELIRWSEEHPNITTRGLCEIIKRETAILQVSHVEFLRINNSHHLVGAHTDFISHCWDYNFSLVVQAIVDHPPIKRKLEKNQPVFVWFDLFSFNQHNPIRSKEFLRLIKRIIKESDSILSVWVPYNLPSQEIVPQLPLAFTRIWCIFELFYAYKEENDIEFVMPKDVRRCYKFALKSEVKDNGLEDFEDIEFIEDILDIDIKEVDATDPNDKVLILNYIKKVFSRDTFSEFLQNKIKLFIYDDICDFSSKKHSSNKYIKRVAKSFYEEAEEIDMMYIDVDKRKIRSY
eukprot:gene2088-2227_t